MRYRKAWTMPPDDARTFLQQLQRKIASSDIEVRHRDALIRLRSMIEEDLDAEAGASSESHFKTQASGREAA
jgi:hypothetical protein